VNRNLPQVKRDELRLRDDLRAKRDDLKDHIFNLAGLPLRRIATCDGLSPRQNRLPFRKSDGNQSDSDKGQLTEAIRQLNDEYERNQRVQNLPKTKNLLFGIKDYYDLLNEMLPPDQYIVFPNMALQSIWRLRQRVNWGRVLKDEASWHHCLIFASRQLLMYAL
jgi:hypothetical protein